VDDAAIGNCRQPRAKRPTWIVSMADHMNGQQHVLHRILYIGWLFEAARGERPDVRCYTFQECSIGLAVAVLRPCHQFRPIRTITRFVRVIRCRCGNNAQRCGTVPADRHQESILRKLTLAYPCNYTRNDQDDRKEFFRGPPVTFRRRRTNLLLSVSYRDATGGGNYETSAARRFRLDDRRRTCACHADAHRSRP